jgi:hypothetical protein
MPRDTDLKDHRLLTKDILDTNLQKALDKLISNPHGVKSIEGAGQMEEALNVAYKTGFVVEVSCDPSIVLNHIHPEVLEPFSYYEGEQIVVRSFCRGQRHHLAPINGITLGVVFMRGLMLKFEQYGDGTGQNTHFTNTFEIDPAHILSIEAELPTELEAKLISNERPNSHERSEWEALDIEAAELMAHFGGRDSKS